MEIVKLPEMSYEGLSAEEALMKFYADLGWNSKRHKLNPKNIKLSEHDHLAFTKILMQLEPEKSNGINLMMLNFGPSCGYEKVKSGSVRLYDGWKT